MKGDLRRRNRNVALRPALFGNAGEKAQPQFMLERVHLVAAPFRSHPIERVIHERAIHVARHTANTRHFGKVQLRVIRRIHIDA
jgi:hypothetical protein